MRSAARLPARRTRIALPRFLLGPTTVTGLFVELDLLHPRHEYGARWRWRQRLRSGVVVGVASAVLVAGVLASAVWAGRSWQRSRAVAALRVSIDAGRWDEGDGHELAALVHGAPEDDEVRRLQVDVAVQRLRRGEIGIGDARRVVTSAEATGLDVTAARALVMAVSGEGEPARGALRDVDWAQVLLLRATAEPTTLRWHAARAALESLLDAGQTLPHILEAGLAVARRQTGDPAQARRGLQRAADRGTVSIRIERALTDSLAGQESREDLREVRAALDGGLPPRWEARAELAVAVASAHFGDRDEAVRALSAAAEVAPRWDRETRRLALELAGLLGAATQAEQWATLAPAGDVDEILAAAWAHFAAGESGAALGRLSESADEEPVSSYLRGLALIELSRPAEARRALQRAEAWAGARPAFEVARTRIRGQLGDPVAALHRLEALTRIHPYAHRAWTGLSEAQVAVGMHRDIVAATAAQAIEREARPGTALAIRAGLRSEPADRRDDLYAAAKAQPGVGSHERALAEELLGAGRPQAALEAMHRAVQRGRDAQAAAWLADRTAKLAVDGLATAGEAQRQLDLARALGASEEDLEMAARRVEVLRDEDLSVQSRLALRSAVRDRPRDPALRVVELEADRAAGAHDRAQRRAKRALKILPASSEGPIYLAWALTQRDAGEHREAARLAFRAWVRTASSSARPSELLYVARWAARIWLEVDNGGGARAIARELTDALPDSAEAWSLRAGVQHQAGFEDYSCASAQEARRLAADVELPNALSSCDDSAE